MHDKAARLLVKVVDILRDQRLDDALGFEPREGAVRIVRVNEDSPADVAGLQIGDQILRIDGTAIRGLAQLWQQLWSQPQAERAVRLSIRRGSQEQEIVVHAVDRAKALRRPQGI